MLPAPSAGGPGEGYELGATLVPARAVGGDLYDHFRDGSRVFFLAGDVSGKGIAAALFMARAKSVFEADGLARGRPRGAARRVNRSLCRDNEAGMFVTAVAGVLDLGSGELTFALAGHDTPVLVPAASAPDGAPRRGRSRARADRGFRLPGEPPPPGSGRRGRPLHRRRVGGAGHGRRVLRASSGSSRPRPSLRHAPATALTAGLLAAVRAFAGEAPQSDDITIVTLRRLAG